MKWTHFLKDEFERTYAITLKLVDQVDPDTLSWKPSTGINWMTMGQLLQHLTNACGAGCRGFVTGDWGLPPGVKIQDIPLEEMIPPAEKLPSVESVDAAREKILEDKKIALQMIDETDEATLALREVEAPWTTGVWQPLGVHLFHMVQHLDRHKSQLFYYLKLQGKPVSTPDLWGA